MYPACNAAWDVFDTWTTTGSDHLQRPRRGRSRRLEADRRTHPRSTGPAARHPRRRRALPAGRHRRGLHRRADGVAWSGIMTSRHDPRLGNPEWVDNWTVGEGLRMEFIDAQGQVWLCHEPVTEQRARALSLPDGASLALLGGLVADAAYFSRSPLADTDGPLDTMEVDGLRFSFVARPVGQRTRREAPTVLSIDKHHTMLYASGRRSTCSTSATAPSPRPHGALRTHAPDATANSTCRTVGRFAPQS